MEILMVNFCEITLSLAGKNLFVKKNASTYEESPSKAIVSLQKMMRRNKEVNIASRNGSSILDV
jgi:hypothetical protein